MHTEFKVYDLVSFNGMITKRLIAIFFDNETRFEFCQNYIYTHRQSALICEDGTTRRAYVWNDGMDVLTDKQIDNLLASLS